MLGRYRVELGISDGAMNHLLKTSLPFLGVNHAVRSVYAIMQCVDQKKDCPGHHSWRRETTERRWNDAHPEPIEFYSRDIVHCAQWLLRQPAYDDHLVYSPERQFNDAGDRVYGEMHTADW
jgi:hypothetical protein